MKRSAKIIGMAALVGTILSDQVMAKAKPSADVITMICSNPRREYVVRYNPTKRRLTVGAEEGSSPYNVTNVERTKGWFVVSGQSANGGPRFQAFFVPQKAMRYFADDFEQTDRCR